MRSPRQRAAAHALHRRLVAGAPGVGERAQSSCRCRAGAERAASRTMLPRQSTTVPKTSKASALTVVASPAAVSALGAVVESGCGPAVIGGSSVRGRWRGDRAGAVGRRRLRRSVPRRSNRRPAGLATAGASSRRAPIGVTARAFGSAVASGRGPAGTERQAVGLQMSGAASRLRRAAAAGDGRRATGDGQAADGRPLRARQADSRHVVDAAAPDRTAAAASAPARRRQLPRQLRRRHLAAAARVLARPQRREVARALRFGVRRAAARARRWRAETPARAALIGPSSRITRLTMPRAGPAGEEVGERGVRARARSSARRGGAALVVASGHSR